VSVIWKRNGKGNKKKEKENDKGKNGDRVKG